MATIIDSFVVMITGDASGFRKGAAEATAAQKKLTSEIGALEQQIATIRRKSSAATKQQDDAQIKSLRDVMNAKRKALRDNETAEKDQLARQKEQTVMLGKIKTAALEVFAVFAGAAGIKSFISDLVVGDAALGRFAANMNTTPQYVGALGAAIASVGGQANEAQQAIGLLGQTRFAAQMGDMSKLPGLSRLGVSQGDLNDPTAALLKMAAASQTMSKAEFFPRGSALGFSEGTLNLLEQGPAAVQALIDKYAALQKITDEQIARDQAFVGAITDLRNALAGAGRDLLGMIPAPVINAIKWLTTDGLPVLEGAILGVTAAAVALGLALAIDFAPIIGAVAAVAAIGAAIAWVATSSSQFAQGIREALGNVRDAISDVLGGALDLEVDWKRVGDTFGTFTAFLKGVVIVGLDQLAAVIHFVGDGMRVVVDLLTGRWSDAWKDAGTLVTDQIKDWTNAFADAENAAKDMWYAFTHKGASRTSEADKLAAQGVAAANEALRSGGGGAPAAAPGTAPGTAPAEADRQAQLAAYLKSQGVSDAAILGIVAGATAESRLDPKAVNHTSGAYGIGQWLGSRKRALFAKYRHPTFEQQSEFLVSELKGGDRGGASVLNAPTSAAALDAYASKFMRARAGVGGDIRRGSTVLASLDPGLIRGASAFQTASTTNTSNSRSSQTSVDIGSININAPNAKDSKQIAATIGPAIQSSPLVAMADTGMS